MIILPLATVIKASHQIKFAFYSFETFIRKLKHLIFKSSLLTVSLTTS